MPKGSYQRIIESKSTSHKPQPDHRSPEKKQNLSYSLSDVDEDELRDEMLDDVDSDTLEDRTSLNGFDQMTTG